MSAGGNKPVRPNIVVMMADDLGWANAGYHGSFIQTPSLSGRTPLPRRRDALTCQAAKLLTGSTGFVDVFRIDSMDMNALTGNARIIDMMIDMFDFFTCQLIEEGLI
jgi:hypothetical protein